MLRAFALAVASFAVCFLSLASGTAHATPPGGQATPVVVLTLFTDDADDAADALTQALRAQVRASPGWTLTESAQSFETLAIALRCPQKPDAACLQRIGDQLHASRYIWGTAAKHRGSDVEAAVHLWTRGRPSVDSGGTFADTLKDPNDPAVRAVAGRLWEELTGATAAATLVVRAGAAGGTVVVDGEERDALRSGTARVTVAAGDHTVEARVPGFRTAPQTVSVGGGAERTIDFALTPVGASVADESHEPPANGGGSRGNSQLKSILGYTAIAVGAGLLVAAGVEAGAWVGDKNASDRDRANVPNTVSQVCSYNSQPAADACQQGKNAKNASILGWVFAGAGVVLAGTGTWLVVSDVTRAEPRDGLRLRVIPDVGAQRQTLSVQLSF